MYISQPTRLLAILVMAIAPMFSLYDVTPDPTPSKPAATDPTPSIKIPLNTISRFDKTLFRLVYYGYDI